MVLELGEVPGVPLPNPHGEGVEILVHLIQQRDGLDDHVVGPCRVELDKSARVRVAESELLLLLRAARQTLDERREVEDSGGERCSGGGEKGAS